MMNGMQMCKSSEVSPHRCIWYQYTSTTCKEQRVSNCKNVLQNLAVAYLVKKFNAVYWA